MFLVTGFFRKKIFDFEDVMRIVVKITSLFIHLCAFV